MDELRNNPQIIELLETLEENGMQKEKGEVTPLALSSSNPLSMSASDMIE